MALNALSLLAELGKANLYKRSQGRVARGVTFAVISIISCYGTWAFYQTFLTEKNFLLKVVFPVLVAASGVWIAYRLVNHDRFAEFLIATESEVDKVHWPDRKHVHRATVVVIVTMLLMGVMLFVFDFVWRKFFEIVGFLELTG